MKKKWIHFFIFLSLFTSAFADDDEQEDSSEEAQSEKLTTYDQGFWLYKHNGTKSLRVGGYLELDGRFFFEPHNFFSEFLIRRARLYATGQITDLWGYMLMASWDRQEAGLHYAWIDTLIPESARLRFGLFKEPFGLEALYTDLYWDFDERSLGSLNYLNIEDIGAMFFGKSDNDRLEYGIGVFNGNGKELDTNGGKELCGRVVIAPFLGYGGLFDRLYFGFSGMYARTDQNLSGDAFRTGAETDFWIWAGDEDDEDDENNVIAHGGQTKWGADFEWLYESAALRAEWLYIHASKVTYQNQTLPFHGHSWYVESSYIVTGERVRRNGPVVPFKDFVLCEGGGAIQLAARYEQFFAPERFIRAGFATGSHSAQGVTLALNWFFNKDVALKLDWQYLKFANDVQINNRFEDFESVVTARLQADF